MSDTVLCYISAHHRNTSSFKLLNHFTKARFILVSKFEDMKRNMFNRKKGKQFALLCIVLCLFSFAPLHHGWSSYDQTKPKNVTGKILEVSYENPHGMIKLEEKKKKWTIVLAPPSRMESRGLTKDMLKVGTTATVVAYPHLKIKDEMRAERITIADKTTELR
jgi:hypothetical protein